MDRRHDMLRTPRSLEDYWPARGALSGSSSTLAKQQSRWPPLVANMSAWTSWTSTKTKHRHSHYGFRSGGQGQLYTASGNCSETNDFRLLHLQRQFSEDSGFSSCGSSASSVADDIETFRGPVPKSSFVFKSTVTSASYGQSGTVASVLAAGVSDSEETDQYDSDEDGTDGVFCNQKSVPPNQFYLSCNDPKFQTVNKISSSSHVQQFLQKVATGQEELQLSHSGRDLLDLGTNLATKFPLRATELPEMNLPLFLQNRSQYHRLGKFGTAEDLCFASCMKKCGFSFPVPPQNEA